MEKAVLLLSAAFPDRKLEPALYFELLKDLKDEPFMKAAIDVCKTQKELYPGTNLVAILRDRTMQLQQVLPTLPKLEGRRWVQPHAEFKALVDRLAKEKSA